MIEFCVSPCECGSGLLLWHKLPGLAPRLDKVVCSIMLRRNTGKGTPVTAELVGMHIVKPFRAWFSCSPAVGGAAGGRGGGGRVPTHK